MLKSQPNLKLDCYNSSIETKQGVNHMNIETQSKTAFGTVRQYVINEQQADAIKTLTGKLTVNDNDLIALMQLGLTVNGKSLKELIAV